MKLSLFMMPSHPPERDLKEGYDFDLQTLIWADEYGYEEAWIGEHHTAPWEPHPAPDLLTMDALRQTKNIRIGPGGFLLPYYHPAELANRVSMMDHLSEGRLNFGVAASGLPSDWAMFGVDGMEGENRVMFQESMDIIMGMWSEKPGWSYEGKYWSASLPEEMFGLLKPHLTPLQKPYPPIGVAGLSTPSPTLEYAGEQGWIPLSLNFNPTYVHGHWDSYEAGAKKAGKAASRSQWRQVREVFIADTDEEAWDLAVNGPIGRMMGEYFLPLLAQFDFTQYLKHDQDVADEDVTVEYCAKHNWLIGSPETVKTKIEKMYSDCGGFGYLTLFCFDYADNPEPWRRSMELLGTEVMPALSHLTGD